jgi:integrase
MVFVTPKGLPLHYSEVLKEFKAACARAGIEPRRFHDLRHSTATLMREVGVAEDTRMSRLGHNTTTMARHYSGASEVQDRDAAERLGRALG